MTLLLVTLLIASLSSDLSPRVGRDTSLYSANTQIDLDWSLLDALASVATNHLMELVEA